MYEESFKMPFVIKCPGIIQPGTISDQMIMNVDFAPTLIDFAGLNVPGEMQGTSFKGVFTGMKSQIEKLFIIIITSGQFGIKYNLIMVFVQISIN